MVLRKNYTDLKEWIDRAQKMFKPCGGKYVNGMFIFPSGATIWLGHIADENSYQKYQGFNIHKLLIEELTHIPRLADYIKILGSVRSTNPLIKAQVFATTNPDGPGYEWVKERWQIPDRPVGNVYKRTIKNGEYERYLEFIPSRVTDNVYLAENKDYMSYLNSIQDEELKRAWLEGSWEGFGVEGSYYKTQIDQAYIDNRVRPGLYDPLLPVYTWCDLGIRDDFAIVYVQFYNLDIRFIDYDEFDGESIGDAKNRMYSKGYTYAEHFAPHDINVRDLSTGMSRKDYAAKMGLYYNTCGNIPVIDGINAVRTRFSKFYFDTVKCELLLKRLRNYRKEFDDKRGFFKDKPVHDINSHAADAVRYCAITEILPQSLADNYESEYNPSVYGTR